MEMILLFPQKKRNKQTGTFLLLFPVFSSQRDIDDAICSVPREMIHLSLFVVDNILVECCVNVCMCVRVCVLS